MKKVLLFTLVLFLSISAFAQTQKIGYVDSQTIMAQYSGAIKAQSDLEAIVAEWNTTIENMKKDYQRIVTDYNKKLPKMDEKAKKSATQDLAKREQEIVKYQQQKFGQGGEIYIKQEELLKPVRDKVKKAIAEVAKEEKMKFVFDKTGDAFLLFADSEFDITFKVLDKLKRGK